MIEITMLGTSGSTPAKDRMMPSVAIVHEGDAFLFDCGEGTQMQLLSYGVNSSKIRAVFLTHVHGDHILGIAGLLRTWALNNRKEEIKIFVPEGSERVIQNLVVFDKAIIKYPVKIIGVKSRVLYKGKDFMISSFKLNHTISTYGYVFKENDKRKFMKEKCVKLGIKGPMFSELQNKGTIKIKGKTIRLDSVSVLQTGKKIVYASDTKPAKSTITASSGADILIHESSYMEKEKGLAIVRKHSTSTDAATIAKKAKVGLLVLTHFSARYKDTGPLLQEAKKIFKNTVAAGDGYKISI